MAEFVKKTAFSYKEVPGGYSDPECTHVILTKKEYDKQIWEISAAKKEVMDTKYNADREIAAAKQEADQKARQAAQRAQGEVEAIQVELAEEKAENAHQRALNANLLRICKERANAERGLKPKKERSGYVVVHSEEKEYSFRNKDKQLYKVKLWETIVQSPYSVELTEAVVRKQISEDLCPEEGEWIVARIGITGRFNGGYEKMREAGKQHPEDDFYRGNVLIAQQQRLRRNFRSQYWEVAIVHTKALGDVPEDLMPARKKPVQGP